MDKPSRIERLNRAKNNLRDLEKEYVEYLKRDLGVDTFEEKARELNNIRADIQIINRQLENLRANRPQLGYAESPTVTLPSLTDSKNGRHYHS